MLFEPLPFVSPSVKLLAQPAPAFEAVLSFSAANDAVGLGLLSVLMALLLSVVASSADLD